MPGFTLDSEVLDPDVNIKVVGVHWDFGDGTTSNEQHPVHTYARDNAHYVVTLYVEGPEGKARNCKVWEVCVRDLKNPSNTPYD